MMNVSPAERALVDAQVGELAVAAVLELERERDERLVRVGLEHDRFRSFVALEIERLVLDVGRARQVAHDGVEQQLHALVLVGRAEQHRRELPRERSPWRIAWSISSAVTRSSSIASVSSSENIETASSISSRVGRGLGLRSSAGISASTHVLAVVALEVERLHADEIDDALELAPRGRSGICISTGLWPSFSRSWSAHARSGSRPARSHLLTKARRGTLVAAHLPVDGDRLGLHAGDAAQHEDRAVEHAQRALDLDGEVDVARRVDDVDVVLCSTRSAVAAAGW